MFVLLRRSRLVAPERQEQQCPQRQQTGLERERGGQPGVASNHPSQSRPHELPRREESHVPEDHGVLQLRAGDHLWQHALPRRLLEGRYRSDHGREREHRPHDRYLGRREHDVHRRDGRSDRRGAEQEQPWLDSVRDDPAQQRQEHPRQGLDDERTRDHRRPLVWLDAVPDEQRHRHDLDSDTQRCHHRGRQPRPVVAADEGVAGPCLRGGLRGGVGHTGGTVPVAPHVDTRARSACCLHPSSVARGRVILATAMSRVSHPLSS